MTEEQLKDALELARQYDLMTTHSQAHQIQRHKNMARALLYYTTPRPIEEAPKDGTEIMAYFPQHYFGPGWYLAWWDKDYCDTAWCTAGRYCSDVSCLYTSSSPTRFHPLPPAPEGGEPPEEDND